MADTYAIPTGAITASASTANDIYLLADFAPDNAQQVVTFTVPVGLTMRLPVPLLTETVTVTVNAVSKDPIFNGDAPLSTQVAFDLDEGIATFHSAASGLTAIVTMNPEVSVVPSNLIVYLQRVIEAVKAVAGSPRVVIPLQWGGDASSTGSGTARTIKLPLDAGTWEICGVSATADGQAGTGSASTFLIGTAYSGTPTNYWTITIADAASSAATVTTATNGSVARTSGQDIVIWQTVAGNHRFPTIYLTLRRTA